MVPIVTMSEELDFELPNDDREAAQSAGEENPAAHTSMARLLLSSSAPAMSRPAKYLEKVLHIITMGKAFETYAVFFVVGMRALKPWDMARVKFSGEAM
jgi:hypothetical protein